MDYELLRDIRNRKNAFGNLVGVKIVEIREGYAKTELEVRPELMNPIDSLHGGVLFTMIDITGGSAAVSHGGYPLSTTRNRSEEDKLRGGGN